MKKTLSIAAISIILVLLLASCVGIADQEPQYGVAPTEEQLVAELATVKQDRDSLSSQLKEAEAKNTVLQSGLDEAEAKITVMQSELDEWNMQSEQYAKYKKLSDLEIFAQMEANKTNADKDRIAREELLAEENAKKEAKEAEEKAAKEKEEKKGYDTGITYSNLARTPDEYEGKKVKFKGKVIQVLQADGEVDIRLAVNSDYDEILLAYYPPSLVSSRVLEDDIITIYGVSKGLYTYESTMGGHITVPFVSIDRIDQ